MHCRSFRVFLLGVVLLLGLAAALRAPTDPVTSDIENDIHSIEAKIAGWERNARVLQVLILAVAILGLVSSAIQRTTRPWGKNATIAIGLLISALTLTHDNLFPGGRKGYLSTAVEGRKILREIRDQYRVYQLDPDLSQDLKRRLDFLSQNITPRLNRFEDLESRLLAVFRPSWEPSVVYAAAVGAPAVSVTGWGACNSSWQAQENSYQAAMNRMTLALRKYLPQSGGPAQLEALRKFVADYAERGKAGSSFDKSSRLFRYDTELRIHPLLLQKQTLGLYVQQQQQAPPPSPGKVPAAYRLQGALQVPSDLGGASPVTRAITLQDKDPKQGKFTFHFALERTKSNAVSLRLDRFEIHEDASGMTTRWTFEFLVNDELAFDLPTQRYSDAKKPTACVVDPESGRQSTFQPSGPQFQIKVRGYKPKDL